MGWDIKRKYGQEGKHVFNVAHALAALCCWFFCSVLGRFLLAAPHCALLLCRPRQPPLHPLYHLLLPGELRHGQAGPHPPGCCHPALCCCATKRGRAHWVAVLCPQITVYLLFCAWLGGEGVLSRILNWYDRKEVAQDWGGLGSWCNFKGQKFSFGKGTGVMTPLDSCVSPTPSCSCQICQLLSLLELHSCRQRYDHKLYEVNVQMWSYIWRRTFFHWHLYKII